MGFLEFGMGNKEATQVKGEFGVDLYGFYGSVFIQF
jgi:hypothetical protein